MKPCKTYEQDLLLLAHGQLDTKSAARIHSHLSSCAPCGQRFTQLAGVSLLLADAVYSAPTLPIVPAATHSSFLPAKQQWLLSAFLGGCILFAVLSLMKTAQSYAAPLPGMTRSVLFASSPAPLACDSPPPCAVQTETARIKVQQKQNAATPKPTKAVTPAANF